MAVHTILWRLNSTLHVFKQGYCLNKQFERTFLMLHSVRFRSLKYQVQAVAGTISLLRKRDQFYYGTRAMSFKNDLN